MDNADVPRWTFVPPPPDDDDDGPKPTLLPLIFWPCLLFGGDFLPFFFLPLDEDFINGCLSCEWTVLYDELSSSIRAEGVVSWLCAIEPSLLFGAVNSLPMNLPSVLFDCTDDCCCCGLVDRCCFCLLWLLLLLLCPRPLVDVPLPPPPPSPLLLLGLPREDPLLLLMPFDTSSNSRSRCLLLINGAAWSSDGSPRSRRWER